MHFAQPPRALPHAAPILAPLPWLPSLLALLVALLCGADALAQPAPLRLNARQLREAQALRLQSPEAADLLDAAEHDLAQNALTAALEKADRALALAPATATLERLRSFVLTRLGRSDDAVTQGREALRREGIAAGRSVLSVALLARDHEGDVGEALSLMRQALAEEPGDGYTQLVACQAAVQGRELGLLHQCHEGLERSMPGREPTLRARLTEQLFTGELDGAERTAGALRARGWFTDEEHADLVARINGARPWPLRAWRAVVRPYVLAWLAALALLVASGTVLRALTLVALRRGGGANPGPGERAVRAAYRVVVALCGWFFYASAPMMVLGTLLFVYAALRLLGLFDTIPVMWVLLSLAGLLALLSGTLVSLFRALGRGAVESDPGLRLDLAAHPRLAQALAEVAGKVRTAPVDVVFLEVGANAGVFEQGTLSQQLRGRTQRCLLVGAALLEGLDVQALKAVLAHEFAHFRNEDTAGGHRAMGVRRSIRRLLEELESAPSTAGFWSPAWLFVQGYLRLYLWLAHGASRLQEVLADRWSAQCYGSEAASRGLQACVERGARFGLQSDAVLTRAIREREYIDNLFVSAAAEPVADAALAAALEKARAHKPSWLDSHPPHAERLASLAAMGFVVEPREDEAAWSLFDEPEGLQRALTEWLRTQLGKRGRSWPATQEEADGARAQREGDDGADHDAQGSADGEPEEQAIEPEAPTAV